MNTKFSTLEELEQEFGKEAFLNDTAEPAALYRLFGQADDPVGMHDEQLFVELYRTEDRLLFLTAASAFQKNPGMFHTLHFVTPTEPLPGEEPAN